MTSTTLSKFSAEQIQRLQTAVDTWKRKLLDLTKRNRALNFKVQSVSTVTIVNELPAAVFTKLWIEGSSMRFVPAENVAQTPAGPSGSAPDELLEEEEPAVSKMDSPSQTILAESQTPYTTAEREKRYYDKFLETAAPPDKLDKSLRRLADQANLALEEQGVNPLFLALGMLHYTEASGPTEVFKAPIVLLPVELSRKSARVGYSLSASGDDPLINPALGEYLRRNHSLALPDLPDTATMDDKFDLQSLLTGVREAVKDAKGWAVTDEIYLGLFSFQKFVMYKDTEQNGKAIASHRLISRLILRSGPQYNGLPADVKTLDLDKMLPPEVTFQVGDADASQLRAIAAVAKNYDLVMEGPPGTGKSQTITNLIALALAAGKSVLFVAEKNAALKVVHQRLVQAGLGDYCLELHSTKANKRAVLHELERSLDASLQQPAVSQAAGQKLPKIRAQLTAYVRELHQPFGALAISPYQVFGRYGAVFYAPRAKYEGPVESVTQAQIDQTLSELAELAAASTFISDPTRHPWRDTTRTFYTETTMETVSDLFERIQIQVTSIANLSQGLARQLGLPPLQMPGDLPMYLAVADVVARSPGMPLAVLTSEVWDSAPPREALDFINRGRDLQSRIQSIRQLFKPDVFDEDHTSNIIYVHKKLKGPLSFAAGLDSKYRTIQKRWQEYRLPTYRGSLAKQIEFMKKVDQINLERKQLAEETATAQNYFGNHWQGENSDWVALETYTAWVVEFRRILKQHALGQPAMETAQASTPDLSTIGQLQKAVSSLEEARRALAEAVGWPDSYLAQASFSEVESRARDLVSNLSQAHHWAAFASAQLTAERGLASRLVSQAMNGAIAFGDLPAVFQRAFYQKWLDTALANHKPLLEFSTLLHERRVAEFKELDQLTLTENRNRLIARVRDDVQNKLQTSGPRAALPFLRREIARQRGLSPLRRTLKTAGAAIRVIKPCFMMSPLTVAQLLDASQPDFDLVLFDEASQLPTEDAIGAIVRGKQLVVVGDPKQLPPTNFFGVMNGQIAASFDEDGQPLYEDGESILEELIGAGLPISRLKWHYRSAHESLIHFSNVRFYDGELYTFPSVEFTIGELGVSFEYVEDGLYEGKGLNRAEAYRVVDAVVEHAQLFPDLTLGVGTFNLRQQLAIQDEVERRRRLDADLDAFCSRGDGEPFFVKNLENIQGDERDVIFISVTYGKGLDGRLRYNFGPLNGENGWRRLNVLASRARQRMKVFSSIRAEDISPAGLTSVGARLLREFLLYVETGRFSTTEVNASATTESSFEHDVYTELRRHGISVVPQVGVSGYRVDLGIRDDTVPGRFICGIECDGVTYHASETARDRDRLRQQVLEARGWLIYRVWSTDWYKDRAEQIKRLLDLIQRAREIAQTAPARVSRKNVTRITSDVATGVDVNRFDLTGTGLGEGGEDSGLTDYARPQVPPYKPVGGKGHFKGQDILDTPIDVLAQAILTVVRVESPIHFEDVVTRLVGFWGSKAGKRIVERITEACEMALQTQTLVRKGDFLYFTLTELTVRSRSGLKVIPERIAPEEYRAATLLVLRAGKVFLREQLISEVRAILGFGRTTAALDELIGQVVDSLLANGIAGEASNGIKLRG